MPFPMPTQAEKYFEEWDANPGAREAAFHFIVSQINDPDAVLEECEWLDYKAAAPFWYHLERCKCAGTGAKSGERQNSLPSCQKKKACALMSEAVSAFANVSGGLLIWGIDAPDKKPDRAEFAFNLEELRDFIQKRILDACDPPVPGVRLLSLSDPTAPDRGILVLLIPESTRKPHQSKFGSHTFWQRTQDSCTPIPASLLRTMFHPKARPYCRIDGVCKLMCSRKDPALGSAQISFFVSNTGEGSASEIYLQLGATIGGAAIELYENLPLWTKYDTDFHCACNFVLHPGQRYRVGRFMPKSPMPWIDLVEMGIVFEATVFARDMESISWHAELTHDIIYQAAKSISGRPTAHTEVIFEVTLQTPSSLT
jgi:hypothetical protein